MEYTKDNLIGVQFYHKDDIVRKETLYSIVSIHGDNIGITWEGNPIINFDYTINEAINYISGKFWIPVNVQPVFEVFN